MGGQWYCLGVDNGNTPLAFVPVLSLSNGGDGGCDY